jgi:hypothetical protein
MGSSIGEVTRGKTHAFTFIIQIIYNINTNCVVMHKMLMKSLNRSSVSAIRKKGEDMEYLQVVNNDKLEQKHICCAISNHKDVQVLSKKR